MGNVNKKSFNISKNESAEFDITPFGKGWSFDTSLNKSKVFSLVIYGLDLVGKYRVRFRNKINIVASAFMKTRAIATIKNKLNIIPAISQLIHLRNTSMSSSISMVVIFKNVWRTLISFIGGISFEPNLREKSPTLVSFISELMAVFENELRSYFTLSYYDPLTLAQLDGRTLHTMDFSVGWAIKGLFYSGFSIVNNFKEKMKLLPTFSEIISLTILPSQLLRGIIPISEEISMYPENVLYEVTQIIDDDNINIEDNDTVLLTDLIPI